MSMLEAYHVSNFRPFGPHVRLEGLEKVNIVAGPNNIGKTALFLPMRRMTRIHRDFVPVVGTPDGEAQYGGEHHARFIHADVRDGSGGVDVLLRLLPGVLAQEVHRSAQMEPERVGQGISIPNKRKVHWTDEIRKQFNRTVSLRVLGWNFKFSIVELEEIKDLDDGDAAQLAILLAEILANRIRCVVAERLPPTSLAAPELSSYEERRSDGRELLHELAASMLPTVGAHPPVSGTGPNLELLQEACDFTAEVLGCGSCEVSMDLNEPALHVALGDDPPRSLRDVGVGVTHVLTMAVAVARSRSGIIILEEPETGLHPATQRRLISALLNRDVQAFVTTHSNHILDVRHEGTRRYRMFEDPDRPGIRRVEPLDKRGVEALWDLGVRPSSVAEANAVVWVEGPSDAIYIRYWLEVWAPDLIEGQHYTFAFSGGALIAHYTVGLDEVADDRDDEHQHLVDLLDVHPGLFIVADSDRSNTNAELKPTLRAIVEQCQTERIWITDGREVESYVTDGLMLSALGGGAVPNRASPKYMKLERRLKRLGLASSWRMRKTEMASRVVTVARSSTGAKGFTRYLGSRVKQLATFIRTSQHGLVPKHRSS